MASFGTHTNNVIVFGELGAGKSSLINLLLDRNVATVSNGLSGSPFNHEVYSAGNSLLFHTVDWYDGIVKPEGARIFNENYLKFLDSLDNGVSLLIFVIKNGQLTYQGIQGYQVLTEELCQKNVPIILAITHCEGENSLGSWYLQNMHRFKNPKIVDAICGCFLSQDRIPAGPNKSQVLALRDKTKRLLEKSISKNMMVPGWKIPVEHMDNLKAKATFIGTFAGLAEVIISVFS